MTKIALAVAATVIAISLTGCSPQANFACDPYSGGEQVEQITVSSNAEGTPEVSFPTPLRAEKIQSKIIIEGTGPVFTGRNLMDFEFASYGGGNGALLISTSFNGTDFGSNVLGPDLIPNFCSSLAGAKEGSRIVTMIPGDQAHGGQGIPESGVGPEDSLIFVFDLKRVYLERATGSAQLPVAGMPSVVTSPEGVPGITIPKTAPPTELQVAQLIRGNGPLLEQGQSVVVHYSGFLWAAGSKFQASWDSGKPASFVLEEGRLIPGFLTAMVGQPVGSQILAVIPPELGYGNSESGPIPAGSTLIFVIDILGVVD